MTQLRILRRGDRSRLSVQGQCHCKGPYKRKAGESRFVGLVSPEAKVGMMCFEDAVKGPQTMEYKQHIQPGKKETESSQSLQKGLRL